MNVYPDYQSGVHPPRISFGTIIKVNSNYGLITSNDNIKGDNQPIYFPKEYYVPVGRGPIRCLSDDLKVADRVSFKYLPAKGLYKWIAVEVVKQTETVGVKKDIPPKRFDKQDRRGDVKNNPKFTQGRPGDVQNNPNFHQGRPGDLKNNPSFQTDRSTEGENKVVKLGKTRARPKRAANPDELAGLPLIRTSRSTENVNDPRQKINPRAGTGFVRNVKKVSGVIIQVTPVEENVYFDISSLVESNDSYIPDLRKVLVKGDFLSFNTIPGKSGAFCKLKATDLKKEEKGKNRKRRFMSGTEGTIIKLHRDMGIIEYQPGGLVIFSKAVVLIDGVALDQKFNLEDMFFAGDKVSFDAIPNLPIKPGTPAMKAIKVLFVTESRKPEKTLQQPSIKGNVHEDLVDINFDLNLKDQPSSCPTNDHDAPVTDNILRGASGEDRIAEFMRKFFPELSKHIMHPPTSSAGSSRSGSISVDGNDQLGYDRSRSQLSPLSHSKAGGASSEDADCDDVVVEAEYDDDSDDGNSPFGVATNNRPEQGFSSIPGRFLLTPEDVEKMDSSQLQSAHNQLLMSLSVAHQKLYKDNVPLSRLLAVSGFCAGNETI